MPSRRGEACHNAKINHRIVRAIRKSQKPIKEIAARYGLSKSHVINIRKRRYWAHVE